MVACSSSLSANAPVFSKKLKQMNHKLEHFDNGQMRVVMESVRYEQTLYIIINLFVNVIDVLYSFCWIVI